MTTAIMRWLLSSFGKREACCGFAGVLLLILEVCSQPVAPGGAAARRL